MKLTKRIYRAIIGGLLGFTVVVTSNALAQESSWETKTPMPTARSHLRAAAIDGLLYVVGGHNGVTGAVGTLEVYDPGTDTWRTAASMPGIRYGGTIGVIDGKLYMVGGWNYPISGIPTNTLQIYDPQTDTWSTGANMPILSGCNIAGVIGRKLYVLTPCFGYSGYYKFFHVYDPDSNTWTELIQPDNIQAEAAGGVIDGKFYVVGGFDGGAVTATVQVFDPESGTWSLAASMSVPRQTLGARVIDGKLYVVGGQTGTSTVVANTVEVFDPDTDSWSSAPPMPTARGLVKAAVIDRKLYVVGGWDGSGPLNTLEVFGPSSDTRTVFRDEGPPVLAFTPADGATSSSTDVLVEGTATDDIGIASITVIGQLVPFLSTNNPDDPNEVSFSVNLILADGPNFIKVVATDTTGQSTSETHEIAVGNEPVEDDPPPVVEDDPVEEKPVEDDPVVSTFGKVTGGGFILDGTVKHSFGFNIHYDDNGNATMKGQLQFVAHDGTMNYHGNGVSTLEVTENKAVFTGSGLLNGTEGYSYTVKVVDNGDPGRGNDTFSIKITSNSYTYEYSGTLAGGNITVHEVKPKVKKAKDGKEVAQTKTTTKKGKGKKK